MWEKIKEPPNVTKVQSHVMSVLCNVRMVLSNVRKKKENHQMWQKYSHMWCWYCTIWGWYHHMWEKNKGTTECDKSTVTCDVSTTQCDVSTTQCEDGTIKYDVLVTWYSRLPTNGYHTLKKKGYYRIIHTKNIAQISLQIEKIYIYLIYKKVAMSLQCFGTVHSVCLHCSGNSALVRH